MAWLTTAAPLATSKSSRRCILHPSMLVGLFHHACHQHHGSIMERERRVAQIEPRRMAATAVLAPPLLGSTEPPSLTLPSQQQVASPPHSCFIRAPASHPATCLGDAVAACRATTERQPWTHKDDGATSPVQNQSAQMLNKLTALPRRRSRCRW